MIARARRARALPMRAPKSGPLSRRLSSVCTRRQYEYSRGMRGAGLIHLFEAEPDGQGGNEKERSADKVRQCIWVCFQEGVIPKEIWVTTGQITQYAAQNGTHDDAD